MDSENKICKKCSEIIDSIYQFNKNCLKNINILNSYKKILKENKLKQKCDLYVNLNASKRSNQSTVTSKEVKVESFLNNDDMFCVTEDFDFVTESHLSGAVEIKKEIEMNYENCDDESTASWFDTDFVSETNSNGMAEVKNDVETIHESCDEKSEASCYNIDFASEDQIEMKYETCNLDSETLSFNSNIKIEIEETDLKKELIDEIDKTSVDESSKSKNKGK